ncbi:putative peptidase family-domain-containing protein [Sphaerosporella brunnea]|uniref:Putative peptidase family-domain-containing protein n=1 Tax=Sphaerosporella brunnea TaxID=1250544 RepID=A0A5J5EMY9_9PEZI|nr:putative peptidase family-domain-containing protein [Sphaerosporella brunnea]
MLPQITSHLPSSTVHSRLLLVSGIITAPSASGDLWVTAHNYSFPAQSFPVRVSAFKALLHLSPGDNSITLDFRPSSSPGVSQKSVFDVTYVPLLQNPPLHLAIIVGSDSPLRYDDVPNPAEPATLDTAIKKLRMAAYLWQAYTGAEMNAQGFGHRTFRLNEAWMPDTLSKVDSPRRSTARVTVLHSKYSVAHIRDPDRAQQNKNGKAASSLFDIALEAIRESPELRPGFGEKTHVAALFLDSTWDRARSLITGHAALGSQNVDGIALAIFGSHTLFAWPSYLEAVVPAFNDTRPVDTKYCAIDVEGKTYHMAANVGIGAMMHETGHLLGCPHQSSGVMLRDYTRLSRSFTALVPSSLPGPANECHWHRLDCLRFMRHPCLALPSDPPQIAGCINVLPVPTGLLVTCPAPIMLIEFRNKGSEIASSTIEPPRNQSSLVIPHAQLNNDCKLTLFSASPLVHERNIDSSAQLLRNCSRSDPALGTVFRTPLLGDGKGTFMRTLLPYPVSCIRVFSGTALDGIEFFTPDGRSALFGKRGGSPWDMPLLQGEQLVGLATRCGAWVDALSLVLDRRRSEFIGGNGGGVAEAIVPAGARIVAVVGEVAQWVMGIGFEYVFEQHTVVGPPPVPPRP